MILKKRKILLLLAIDALALIYAAQILVSNRSQVKKFGVLRDEIEKITVVTGAERTLFLQKINGEWFAGENSFPADSFETNSILDEISELKAISVVSKSQDEGANRRYGFDEGNFLLVTIESAKKTLLKLEIGKKSQLGEQNYFRVNNGRETYLSGSDLRAAFSITDEEIKALQNESENMQNENDENENENAENPPKLSEDSEN